MKKNNNIRLFLDDERFPVDCKNYAYNFGIDCSIYDEKWAIVRNYKDFTGFIEIFGMPKVISFDHDIADYDDNRKERTGTDCANWLIEYCFDNVVKPPEYYVHSANNVGREYISGKLENLKKFQKKYLDL